MSLPHFVHRSGKDEEDETAIDDLNGTISVRNDGLVDGEGESRPQGLQGWPLIFVQPHNHAIHLDKHWPNIVSLLVGGLPELDGFKKPLYHHEPKLDRKASYYIAMVDTSVAMVVVTFSNHTTPLRPVLDFFSAVCPILRMENVIENLRPLKM